MKHVLSICMLDRQRYRNFLRRGGGLLNSKGSNGTRPLTLSQWSFANIFALIYIYISINVSIYMNIICLFLEIICFFPTPFLTPPGREGLEQQGTQPRPRMKKNKNAFFMECALSKATENGAK